MAKYKKPMVLDPGEYEVEIIKATPHISPSGNEMVVLTLSMVGTGRRLFDRLVYTESADWRIASFLTAIGIQLQEDDDIDECLFVGRGARVLIDVEMFDGQLRNKIKRWLPPKDGAAGGGAK
jgi:hypothetical protein